MKNAKKKSDVNQLTFYILMLVIPIFMFIILNIITNIEYILLSFREFNSQTNSYNWVGLQHFENVVKQFTLQESVLRSSMLNSLELWAWGLFLGMPLAILFSYYIARKKIASGIFQTILFLPSIISSMVLTFLFSFFIDNAIPAIIYKLFDKQMEPLLGNMNTQWGVVIFYNVWVSFSTNVLIFVGAMTGISDEIIESAHLDGATPMIELIYIVLPLIFSSVSTFIITGVAGMFAHTASLYSFFGPSAATQTIGYYLYKDVMEGTASKADYSTLSATGLLFSVIIIPITMLLRWLLGKAEQEG